MSLVEYGNCAGGPLRVVHTSLLRWHGIRKSTRNTHTYVTHNTRVLHKMQTQRTHGLSDMHTCGEEEANGGGPAPVKVKLLVRYSSSEHLASASGRQRLPPHSTTNDPNVKARTLESRTGYRYLVFLQAYHLYGICDMDMSSEL